MCVREMFASSNEGETERIGIRDRDSLTFLVGFTQTLSCFPPCLLTPLTTPPVTIKYFIMFV
jgi:hypothetical protein